LSDTHRLTSIPLPSFPPPFYRNGRTCVLLTAAINAFGRLYTGRVYTEGKEEGNTPSRPQTKHSESSYTHTLICIHFLRGTFFFTDHRYFSFRARRAIFFELFIVSAFKKRYDRRRLLARIHDFRASTCRLYRHGGGSGRSLERSLKAKSLTQILCVCVYVENTYTYNVRTRGGQITLSVRTHTRTQTFTG